MIEDPVLLGAVCHDLLERFQSHPGANGALRGTERIFASANGACDMSYELGRQLRLKRGFTEKGEDKTMILKRFSFPGGTKILVFEDVMTTGSTTLKSIAALEEAGANVLPFVGVILNRSGETHLDNRLIIPLMNVPMHNWDPAECPLCKQGSKPLRPKANWDKLTAKY